MLLLVIFRFADNIIPICLPGNDDLLIGECEQFCCYSDLLRGSVVHWTTVLGQMSSQANQIVLF